MKKNFIFSGLLLLSSLSAFNESNAQTGGATFTPGPLMHRTRISPFMATLSDGRIAAFGGREYNFISCSYADFYDPATNTFSEIAMNYPHDYASVVKLSSGKYYIIGGAMDLGVAPGYATTETFDPTANTFTPSGSMNHARSGLSAAQLSNGKVLIAGAWYSTPGATYGDVYNITAGTYTATNAMLQPRSYPVILPTADSGAIVFGGMPPYGGSTFTSTEFYSSADNSFHAVSSELIPSDPGWLTTSSAHYRRPTEDYKMSSGSYLVFASRTGEYGLLTFDPVTKTFARITTSTPLMDSWTDGGFFDLVLNQTANVAYLLGLDSGSNPMKISIVAVNLSTGYVYHPGSTFTMPSSEYLYPSMAFIPSNGKILLEGISSTTGDYFHATDKTYIITPLPALGIENIAAELQKPACYPNPANDVLNFRFENVPAGTIDIRLFDMTGRVFDNQSINAGTNVVSCKVAHLPAGMYFYEIKHNGSVVRDRFIKN